MGLDLDYSEGQTPLDEDDLEGIKIETISTQAELDEYEQLNNEKALTWILSKIFRKEEILSEEFIKLVHSKMFGDVWKWAGEFRRSNKNLGVEWPQISIELRKLLDDTSYWIENDTFPPDEIAIRFKHRIVSIHCFPNGNGRHSRIMADIIIESIFGLEVFSWHGSNMVKADEVRRKYIDAVRRADQGDIRPLLEFART